MAARRNPTRAGRVAKRSGGIDFHVRFTELDNASELSIARYLGEFELGG